MNICAFEPRQFKDGHLIIARALAIIFDVVQEIFVNFRNAPAEYRIVQIFLQGYPQRILSGGLHHHGRCSRQLPIEPGENDQRAAAFNGHIAGADFDRTDHRSAGIAGFVGNQRRNQHQGKNEAAKRRQIERFGARKLGLRNRVHPLMLARLFDGLLNHAFLKVIELSCNRIGLLFDGGHQDGVQIRMMLLDFARDLFVVELPLPVAVANPERSTQGNANDGQQRKPCGNNKKFSDHQHRGG